MERLSKSHLAIARRIGSTIGTIDAVSIISQHKAREFRFKALTGITLLTLKANPLGATTYQLRRKYPGFTGRSLKQIIYDTYGDIANTVDNDPNKPLDKFMEVGKTRDRQPKTVFAYADGNQKTQEKLFIGEGSILDHEEGLSPTEALIRM